MSAAIDVLLSRAMLEPDAARTTAQIKLASKVAATLEIDDVLDLLRIISRASVAGKGIEKLAERLKKADPAVTGDPRAYEFVLFATAILRQALERDDEICRLATLGIQAISRSAIMPTKHVAQLESVIVSRGPRRLTPTPPDGAARDAVSEAYAAHKANANGVAQHAPAYIEALEKDNKALENALLEANRMAKYAARDARALAWLAGKLAEGPLRVESASHIALQHASEMASIRVSETVLLARTLLELSLGETARMSMTIADAAASLPQERMAAFSAALKESGHADLAPTLRELTSGGTTRRMSILDLAIVVYCELSLLDAAKDEEDEK